MQKTPRFKQFKHAKNPTFPLSPNPILLFSLKSQTSTKKPTKATTPKSTRKKGKKLKGGNETESTEMEEKVKPKTELSPEDERILAFFGSFFGSEETVDEDYGRLFLK